MEILFACLIEIQVVLSDWKGDTIAAWRVCPCIGRCPVVENYYPRKRLSVLRIGHRPADCRPGSTWLTSTDYIEFILICDRNIVIRQSLGRFFDLIEIARRKISSWTRRSFYRNGRLGTDIATWMPLVHSLMNHSGIRTGWIEHAHYQRNIYVSRDILEIHVLDILTNLWFPILETFCDIPFTF